MSGKIKYFSWTKLDFGELVPHNFKGFLEIFSSLSSRNFRLYFIGQCISLCGTWVQAVAMSWLVYRITGSIILLTTVAFVNQIPSLVITPLAGVMSDRYNRFRIILGAQLMFMLQALVLAALVLSGSVSKPSDVWILILLSLFNGLVAACEAPARQSFYTKLVPKESLANAIALNSVTINGSRFIGPTIGGVLIAMVGEGYCFLINGVSYIAVLTGLLMMSLSPYVAKKHSVALVSQLKEGFNYVRSFLPIKAVIIYVAVVSFFGLPFMSIIPALVKDTLGGDSTLLGYVNSSIGAGALTAALYLASRKNVQGLGKVVTICALILGVSIAAMSFCRGSVLACVIAFPLGFALIGSMAASNTVLQTLVDDNKRGRVMSYFTMAFAGMTPLGGIVYGAVAEVTSLSTVLLAAGIICILTGVVYEYFRPIVRAAVHDQIAEHGVVKEIATAIDNSYDNPF